MLHAVGRAAGGVGSGPTREPIYPAAAQSNHRAENRIAHIRIKGSSAIVGYTIPDGRCSGAGD